MICWFINSYFEIFSLLRKERNGLNAAIVLDCIANSLTMVTSIFFIDQLAPFCMYEYTWQTLHVFWQSPFFILNSPSVCALLCVAMVASHIRVMFLSSCIWIASRRLCHTLIRNLKVLLQTWNRLIPIGIVAFRYLMVSKTQVIWDLSQIHIFAFLTTGLPCNLLPRFGRWEMGLANHKVVTVTVNIIWQLQGVCGLFYAWPVEPVWWSTGSRALRCWDVWAGRSCSGAFYPQSWRS